MSYISLILSGGYEIASNIFLYTGVVTSILASFVCKIIGKLASIDVTTPVHVKK